MAKGRPPAGHLPRSIGKTDRRLAPSAERRSTPDGRTTVHVEHKVFTKGPAPLRACQRRVDYINRPGAVEVVLGRERSSAVEIDAGPRTYVHSVSPGRDWLTSFGTIGPSRERQREFWTEVLELEKRQDARVQIGIIVELPCEVTPAGRASILQGFCAEVLESRGLPYWAAAHVPNAKSDERNYHGHILYYPRSGSWANGSWSFTVSREGGNGKRGPLTCPWRTKERPGDRITRLTNQINRTKEAEKRAKYETQLAEAREYQELSARRAAVSRGGVVPKGMSGYPWGEDRPRRRRSRLIRQLQDCSDERRRARYARDLEQVEEVLQNGPNLRAIGPGSRSWIRLLRETWCRHCNAVLAAEGHHKRYVSGSYKSLGIAARPTAHLGSRQSALEARGVLTAAARVNDQVTHDNLVADGLSPAEIALRAGQAWIRIRTRWARAEHVRAVAERRPDRARAWAKVIELEQAFPPRFTPATPADHERPILRPGAPPPFPASQSPAPARPAVPISVAPEVGVSLQHGPAAEAPDSDEPRLTPEPVPPPPRVVEASAELQRAGMLLEAALVRGASSLRGSGLDTGDEVRGALKAFETAAGDFARAGREAGGVTAAIRAQARDERDRLLKTARTGFGEGPSAKIRDRIHAALPISDPAFLPPSALYWSSIQQSHADLRARQAPLMESAHREAAEARSRLRDWEGSKSLRQA